MGECEYCKIVEEKKNLLFEDDLLIAVIPEKPLLKGHIKIIPKKHHSCFQNIDDKDAEHLFYAASFAATALFENLEAHGTNILANTGNEHKKEGHFHLDVLARKMDDGVNLMWTPNRMADPELKEVASKLKDKCDMIGVKRKDKEVVDLDKKPEKLESTEEKASEAKTDSEEKKKQASSEEEQKYKKTEKEEEKKDEKHKDEDKESYLIKQLRRMP